MVDWKIADPVNVLKPKDQKEANVFLTPATIDPNDEWIIELAHEENKMEESATINLDIEENLEKLLKDETIIFLKTVKQKLKKLIKIFNSYKPESTTPIKLYRIENREEDFVVFRNTIKLIFSMHSPGTIQISYNSYKNSLFTASRIDGLEAPSNTSDYIQAQLGPFNEAIWLHNGQKVNIDHMLKYYLQRFIRESIK